MSGWSGHPRAVATPFASGDYLTFNLNRPDFTTAKRVVDQINNTFGPGVAQALDAGSIRVRAPLDPNQRVDYLSMVENLATQALGVADRGNGDVDGLARAGKGRKIRVNGHGRHILGLDTGTRRPMN